MSFTSEKRDSIKRYILEKIDDEDSDFIKRTVDAFSISSNTVYRYLRELKADGHVQRKGKKYVVNGTYELIPIDLKHVVAPNKSTLFEDELFRKHVQAYVNGFTENVQVIWEYCFTEMVNNVLDHSEADKMIVYINQNILRTSMIIEDNGVGIFNKIRTHYNFSSLEDAIVELFKGKLTTDKSNHSGEGVFFSSRAMDKYAAISGGKIFSHSEYNEVLKDLEDLPAFQGGVFDQKGTTIFMQLSNTSKKVLKEIFDYYADVDGGFTRTRIPIKNVFNSYPISRSQAKRLYNRFEKFEEIELDFSDVNEIGQGFAHEIFIVFQNNHKDIEIIPTNANANVMKMINHVMKSQ